ncbi:MAG: hypothetical protein WD052_08620 [Bacteroidales bacterium]
MEIKILDLILPQNNTQKVENIFIAAATCRNNRAGCRLRQSYWGVPLKKGWNHFLIKVASNANWWPGKGTLAVRMESTKKAFESELKSAIQIFE